jgi:hypothetical protein
VEAQIIRENKKMLKHLLTLSLILGGIHLSFSQTYEIDGLRLSTHNFYGTSRYAALGGAFSSVGPDFSNLNHNPAGIGMYRSSSVTVSSGVNANWINSSYRNTNQNANETKFLIPSVGAIFSSADTKNKKSATIQSTAFGIGVNRLADYNRRESFLALNNEPFNSITYSWVEEVTAINGSFDGPVDFNQFSFEAVNAYQTFLVNYDNDLLGYTSPVQNSINQSRFRETSGGKNEVLLTGGFNYLDKIYFGATLGIPIVNYRSTTRFLEDDFENSNPDFQNFELQQNFRTNGVGINLKAGVIYRVSPFMRLALALHSPERLSLSERYSSNIESVAFNINYFYESPEGEFDYKLRTPWRAIVGSSFFLKNKGFLSLDYELIDYSSIRYDFGNNFQDIANPINNNFKAKYKMAHNLRAGIEVALESFRLRGGYNYIGTPFKNSFATPSYNYAQHRISGGWGVVSKKVAFDMTAVYGFSNEVEVPYALVDRPVAPIFKNVNNLMIMATLGFRINDR